MWKRLAGAALFLLMLGGCCFAEDEPVYETTRSFVRALQAATVIYELQGVDEDGDECVLIESDGEEIYCYFDASGDSASFFVWYLAEYEETELKSVLLACSRLNAASGGVCFTADESDCTVTAVMDLLLRKESAGDVALDALVHLTALLPEARQTLQDRKTLVSTPVLTNGLVQAAPQKMAEIVVITAETALVRNGPSGASGYVLTAHQGEQFPYIGQSGDWYIIDCGGRAGFVSSSVAEAR